MHRQLLDEAIITCYLLWMKNYHNKTAIKISLKAAF